MGHQGRGWVIKVGVGHQGKGWVIKVGGVSSGGVRKRAGSVERESKRGDGVTMKSERET